MGEHKFIYGEWVGKVDVTKHCDFEYAVIANRNWEKIKSFKLPNVWCPYGTAVIEKCNWKKT